MRIRCKDLQGSRRALGTTLGLLVTTFIQLAHGEDRLPTREELVAAFERVTRGIPSPLHLSAEVVIAGTPGTDEEIERATERNVRHLESTTGQQLSEAETEKLRELSRTSLSGTKTIHYELWRSRHGKLYRLDEYEVSLGPNATDFTSVNIWDTTFTNVPSFSASKRLGSADIQWDPKARHVELALWDAIGLEAQLAFPLIAALGAIRSDLNPSSEFERIRQSARINSDKIEQLLTDSGPDWHVLATELPDENPPQIELKFTGRVVTPENFRGKMPDKLKVTELQVSYQFEKSNFERLRKVEFSENETGMNYVSLRSNFDENGFPRRWIVQERPRQDASIQKKEIRFDVAERFSSARDWEIFAPIFPEHYIVGELHGDGQSTIISNPGDGEVLTFSISPFERLKRFVAKFLVAFAFLCPLGYAYRRYKRK